MKQLALLMAAAGVLALAGCQNKNKPKDVGTPAEEPYTSLDRMESGSGTGTAAGSTDSTTYTPKYARVPAGDAAGQTRTSGTDTGSGEVLSPTDEPAGGRVHAVQKGDTLYKLARQYYGNASKWKDIYEANRARLSDPSKLTVGMKLIIP